MKNIAIELVKMVNERQSVCLLECVHIGTGYVEITKCNNGECKCVYDGNYEGACYFLIGFIDSMLKTK